MTKFKTIPIFLQTFLIFHYVVMSDVVYACSVCFGKTDAHTLKALQLSILALLGCLAFVMAGFLSVFFQIRRRNKISHSNNPHLAHL